MPTSTVDDYTQLISLAVHELRTPASVVGGYLRMLQRDTDQLSERQRKMIDEAEKSCGRIVALIAELSDVGKLDAGLIALQSTPLDLFSLIDEVAAHVHEGEERDVHLELRGDSKGAPMKGDAGRLRSAFDAIFRAILREKGGPSTVVVDRRRSRIDGRAAATITVSEASTVQEAYERARTPFDDRRGGLGLALPLARRVIEGHGGRLHAPAATTDPPSNDPIARGSAVVDIPLTE